MTTNSRGPKPKNKRRWRSGAKNNPPRSDRYTRTPLERLTGGYTINPEITWGGTPCHLWCRYIDDCGYGRMRMGRENKAHRISYILNVGPIPTDKEIDHLCRQRSCVNPLHLEPVPHRTNMERSPFQMECIKIAIAASLEKTKNRTHCKNDHEMTIDNTIMDGHIKRCLTCEKIWRSAYLERKRLEKLENPKPKISRARITHCKNGHEYTEENTRWTGGKRFCRACSRDFSRERYREMNPEWKSRNVFLEFDGRSMTIADWARDKNIKVRTILARRRYGWTVERTLSEEVHSKG